MGYGVVCVHVVYVRCAILPPDSEVCHTHGIKDKDTQYQRKGLKGFFFHCKLAHDQNYIFSLLIFLLLPLKEREKYHFQISHNYFIFNRNITVILKSIIFPSFKIFTWLALNLLHVSLLSFKNYILCVLCVVHGWSEDSFWELILSSHQEWALGIELKSSGLATNSFTYWALVSHFYCGLFHFL